MTGEDYTAVLEVDSGSVFKKLYKRIRTVYLKYTAASALPVREPYLSKLTV